MLRPRFPPMPAGDLNRITAIALASDPAAADGTIGQRHDDDDDEDDSESCTSSMRRFIDDDDEYESDMEGSVPPQLHGRILRTGAVADGAADSDDDDDDDNHFQGVATFYKEHEERSEDGRERKRAKGTDSRKIIRQSKSAPQKETNSHPDCINNLSKSLRVIDIQDINVLSKDDGMPFCFLSVADGGTLPIMAIQQILCLLHVINSPVTSDHIISHGDFKVVWAKGKKGCRTMDKLTQVSEIWDDDNPNPLDRMQNLRGIRVDELKHDQYIDFGVTGGSECKRVVPMAEIFLAPVTVTYADKEKMEEGRKIFWIVILKPRIVYNFAKHMKDFMRPSELPKDHTFQKNMHDGVYKMMKEVMLYAYSMSPSVSAFMKKENVRNIDPIDVLEDHNEPGSLTTVCNIYEVYRSICYHMRGVTVHSISGFDEHIHLTNEKGSNLYDAVRQQVLWAKAFDSIVIKQNKESKGDKAGKKDDLNPDEPMADDTNPEAEEVYLDHAVGWPVPKSKPRASSDAGGGGDGARDDDDDDDCDMDQPEEGREDENPYEEVLHNDEDAGPRDGGAVATADEEALARPRALFAGIRGTEDEAGWGEGGGRYEEGGAEAEVPEEAWVCRSQQVAESTNSDVLDGPFHYADEKVAPVGMPAPDFPSAEQPTTGLPALEMCMFVDIQQIFGKEHTIADFRNAFGDLPTKARLQLTQLQYKDAGVGQEGATSLDRFMPPARILSQYERMMIFTNALNSMEGFYMAGHYTETYLRNINYLQTNVPQPDQRVSLFSQYLLNSLRVHKSIVMNGNLRSSHAEHTMKYIEQAGKRVHKDLHKLRSMVFADCAADDLEGSTSSHIFTRDLSKQSRWQVQSPDSFVFYSWEYDEMYRHFNAKFVKLTPVNFKTFMEMNISCVMYRLGQNNPHWTRMGMLCSVMDAGGKLTTRDKSKNTKKRTGGGLDYLKWMSDILRMTYRPYLGTYEKTDKQKLVTIRRTTEGSLYDYVVFMGGKLIKVPLDVGYDVVMNEGPNDRYENVNGLFNQIDRDEDPDAAIISTCDPNNTNNRQQTTAEPVSGFKMFLLLIGKNNMLESKAETRYAQMMIPAYPCPTNHSNDQEWAIRLSRNGEADDFMDTENVDSNQLHGGGINSDSNSASRMKGNTPDEKTQKEWAPFAYFVPSVAGTAVALSNKLASWRLPINYAVKNVIDYNFSIIDQHFKCLMSTDDSRNLSRYLENLKCRMVGHTVMRKTHQMMCNSNTPEEAQLKVVQSVCQSGLHMSLVPPLLEQLLSRVVSYAPLIILSIIMPYLNIPVVSLRSVLELFNGSTVSNLREAETIKHFLISTLDNRNFMPMTETSDGGSSNNNVSPYITSKLTWSVGAVVLSGTDVTDLRHVFAQAPEKDALSFALKSISDKIFKKNSSILQDCAFIDDEMVMYSLFSSIRHCTYDMRKFFGGMKHFHDSRYMVHKMTNRTEDGMPNAFENNQRQRADPMFSIRRVSSTRLEYALGVRVWDALLFAALIQRPRRDFGVVSDFSMSIVSHLMQMLPRSIMPYNEVPALRIDAFSEQQMVYKLNARKAQQARRAENQLEVTRPEQVLRFKSNRGIKQDASFAYSSAGPTGLMEDDAFMAPIIALRDYLNIKDFTDIPLHMWCFDIAWEWGVVYPLARYDAADALPPEKFAADSKFALVLNRRCFCMQVYGQEREDLELEKSAQDQARFVPRMTLMAELKPSRKGGRDSFFQCQEDLFKMGLGPMPYIRRPGVAVRLNYGGGETRVGCIVPHQRERHGCRRPQSERCYFCAQNPFYDVMVQGAGRRGAAAARIERLYASHIGCSDKHIIKAGTPLLLRVQCIELLQVFPLSRMDAKHRNKGQGVDEGEEAETSSSNQDHNIMYYSDDDNSNEAPNGQGGDPSLPAGGEEEDDNDDLLVWLQVPNTIAPKDGWLAVGIACKYGADTAQCHVLHVDPIDLRIPTCAEDMQNARQFVYGIHL